MTSRPESLDLLVDILMGAADLDVLDSILLDAVHCACADGTQALFQLDARGNLGARAWRGDRSLLPPRASIRESLRSGTPAANAWVRLVGTDRVLVLSRAPNEGERDSIGALLDCWERRADARTNPDDHVPAALPSGADVGLRKLAHDMRNHVTGLQTTRDVLRTLAQRLDDEERFHYDAVVERECRRAGELLATALGVRPERSSDLETPGADLVLAVRDAVHSERSAFDAAAVELETRIESSCDDVRYPISEVEFSRLVRNLLVNAREACSEPIAGKARVRLECSIGDVQSDEILVAVLDEGPGIAPSILTSLFEVGVSTRRGEGGLGLATVREICDRCGGSVSSWNQPAGGACFEVRIPPIAVRKDR